MAITVIGNLDSVSGTALTSLTITSTVAIGDCRVLFVKIGNNLDSVATVSGGNCTWVRVAGPTVDTNATAHTHEMWLGTATSAGAAAITLTYSISIVGVGTDLDARAFSSGLGSGTTWARDGSQSGFNNNTSSVVVTHPSLTAAGSGELYVGHARCPSGGSYGTPTGGGFTWVTTTDANGNPYIYSLATGSGTVAPAQSTTASTSFAIGVLIIASGAVTHVLAATGLASTSGSMALNLTKPLASTGLASTTGSAALNVVAVLSATGLAATTGTFLIGIPQPLAATGLATTTGSFGLVISKALASDGLAATTGSMTMLVVSSISATGLASTSGSADLMVIRPLAATGLASTSGAFALVIVESLAATGLAATTGSFALAVKNVLAAVGLAATTGSMDLLVRRAIAATGLAATTGSFMLVVQRVPNPFSAVVSAAQPNILDCGTWRVFLATRGGLNLLAELDYETLSLGRKLNDVSVCTVTMLAAKNAACLPILGEIEPFQHEIVAFRNYRLGDAPTWAGPVTVPAWDPLNLTIGARDLFTWMDKRTLPFDRNFPMTDLADIFGQYLVDGLNQDASPNISPLFLGEIGTPGARSVTAISATLAGDALRELSRSGVDFSLVGRSLRYGGKMVNVASTILYDPAIYQDPNGSTPKLTKQGLNMATRVVVKGGLDGAGNQVLSTVGFLDGPHGLISQVVSEPLILDRLSATKAAAGRMAFLNPAPQYLSCVLTPQAPIRFDELLPGIRIDAAFSVGLTTAQGPFRLQQVDVTNSQTGEVVALTLVPLVV